MIGAAIQAGAMIYDGYQNRQTSKENTNKTIAAQKSESELAYQRSIEQWNRQNAYNSPEAQMQRFKAAGLNPHLIYGQGNPGNANAFPTYQPANIQYKYAAGNYGAAIGSILPTLMAVGTWMQDMRLKDQQLKSGAENIEYKGLQQIQLKQLIEYLREKNPMDLNKLENSLSLFPYQESMARTNVNTANAKLQEFLQEVNWRWKAGGMRDTQLEILKKEAAAKGFKNKLLDAQSSWSDLDITNPQGLMQMVLGGVMGLAGQTLKLSTSGKINQTKRPTKEVFRYGSDGRLNYRRREH